jgi:hypothetical protein
MTLALLCGVYVRGAEIPLPVQNPTPLPIKGELNHDVFEIKVADRYPGIYVLECSTELLRWNAVATNVQFREELVFKEPLSRATPHRFYRVRQTDDQPYVPKRVGLRFKIEASQASKDEALKLAGLEIESTLFTQAMETDGSRPILFGRTEMPVLQSVALLKAHPAVERVHDGG